MLSRLTTQWRIIACAYLAGMLAGFLIRPPLGQFLRHYYRKYTSNYQAVAPEPPARTVTAHSAAPSPVNRFEPSVALFENKIYVLGGFDTLDLTITARCDVYNPATDSWTRLADMPFPVTHAGVAEADGFIWVAGGFAGNHPGATATEVWKYDIRRDRWTHGPSLPDARGAVGMARLNRNLHLFGGVMRDRSTSTGTHWVLNLDNPVQWKPAAPLPDPRAHLAAVALGGKVHALGGQHGHDLDPLEVASHHAYDPAAGQWLALRPLPRARSHVEAAAFAYDGRIILAGGRLIEAIRERRVETVALHDMNAYDPASDRWLSLPALPIALRGCITQAVAGRVYFGLGGVLPSGMQPSNKLFWFPVADLALPPSA